MIDLNRPTCKTLFCDKRTFIVNSILYLGSIQVSEREMHWHHVLIMSSNGCTIGDNLHNDVIFISHVPAWGHAQIRMNSRPIAIEIWTRARNLHRWLFIKQNVTIIRPLLWLYTVDLKLSVTSMWSFIGSCPCCARVCNTDRHIHFPRVRVALWE